MWWLLVFFLVFIRLNICDSLIIPIEASCQGASEKNFLFPILVPRIAQDPQNYPEEKTHYFNFKTGGQFVVDLQVLPVTESHQHKLKNTSKETLLNLPNIDLMLYAKNGATGYFTKFIYYLGIFLQGVGGGTVTLALDYKQKLSNPFKQVTTSLESKMVNDMLETNTSLKLINETIKTTQNQYHNKPGNYLLDKNTAPMMYNSEPSSDSKNLNHANQTYILLLSEAQVVSLIGYQVKNSTLDTNKWRVPLVLQDKAFNSYIQSTVRMALPYHRVHFAYTIHTPGNYVVMLLNPSPTPVYISGVLELVNPGNVHLSAQDEPQGPALLCFVWLNLSTTTVMFIILLTKWSSTRTDLHYLMAFNFFMKTLYLSLDWYNNKLFSWFGELSTLNWLLPRMMAKIQDIILLMMFLLLALGWRIHRYQLSLSEIRFCAVICVLSFYLGIFEVSMGGFQATRYILHSLAYLCIIVAINFNLTLISGSLTEMGLSKATAATYRKIEGYSIFRIAFIIFILKPTLLLFYKLTILFEDDKDDWLLLVFDNLIDWSISAAVVYAFRPFENFKLFEDLKLGNEPWRLGTDDSQVDRDTFDSLEDNSNHDVY